MRDAASTPLGVSKIISQQNIKTNKILVRAHLIEKLTIIANVSQKYSQTATYYSMIAWRYHTTVQWIKAATKQSL